MKKRELIKRGWYHILWIGPVLLITVVWPIGADTGSNQMRFSLPHHLESEGTSIFFPFVAHQPVQQVDYGSDGLSSVGGPIAFSPLDQTIWAVNPDSGSVSQVDSEAKSKRAEIEIGVEPWGVAIAPNGETLYVTDRATGYLIKLDTETHQITAELYIGPEPQHIALSPSGQIGYIPLTTSGELIIVDLDQFTVTKSVSVSRFPKEITVTDNGNDDDYDESIYLSHHLSFPEDGSIEATDVGRFGLIAEIDSGSLETKNKYKLPANSEGIANLLGRMAISDSSLWVPHVRAAPDHPIGLSTTVFAAVSSIDLINHFENPSHYLPLNDQEIFGSPVNNPVASVLSPDQTRLYVVLAGSDLIEVIDISQPNEPELIRFLPAGHNPRGMVLDQTGNTGFVLSYLSRSITVLDLKNLEMVAEIPITNESLPLEILAGKKLFHAANNPRLSTSSWISCASCHPGGGTDGLTWIFPDGPRQTPPLWNVKQTAPYHWSAALDELHDVEDTIHLIQHGSGLASGSDPPLLGKPNVSRSPELDTLAFFMEEGIRTPLLPLANLEMETAGRMIFESAGCHTCHGGPYWTSSSISGTIGMLDIDQNGMVDPVLRDVGTLNPRDIRGESGFDPPSLLNVALTPPYFHDGAFWSLEALIRSGHPSPRLEANQLTDTEIDQLVSFLHGIGLDTEPISSE